MKLANKLIRGKVPKWIHEPWTITRIEAESSDVWFQGFNTRTGQRLPPRNLYSAAMADVLKEVEKNPNAEPWGV
jgi:hypothetical protein